MGAVHLFHDRQIGRNVALKVMRGEWASKVSEVARFIREARVQGQLEHPAVVPVYDLGVDPEGAVYFTMKQVRGVSLYDVLADLADGWTEVAERFTRRRLLTAFDSVCLAIDFAHRR